MRLYALLFALLVLRARAASIPETAETEKKIQVPDTVPEKTENTSSEQELIDQTNTIKDVENNLRAKPTENIPVAVIVENPEPIFKISEETDDIVRPEPDLNNPGIPQRQLHETQNPEYHEAEQQSVLRFKQNFNDAQVILRQGFQGVSDGIQHIYENNEQLKTVQQTIKSLHDGFTSQINKLNDTVHHFLNPENPNNEKSADEESKASFQRIETGLSSLKNEFNRGVKTLAKGVDVVASLKAENDGENPDSSAVFPSAPTDLILEYLKLLHSAITDGFAKLTQAVMDQAQGQGNRPSTVVNSNSVPADTPVSTTAASFNPFQNPFQNIQNWGGFFNQNNSQGQQGGSGPLAAITNIPTQITQFFNQNNGNSTSAPTVGAIGSGNGPIVQALQNGPFAGLLNLFPLNGPAAQSPVSTTGAPAQDAVNQVVAAVPVAPAKKLSNDEKQKDAESAVVEVVKEEVVKKVEEETKGGLFLPIHNSHGSGNSGNEPVVVEVEKPSEVVKETPKETVPEVLTTDEVKVEEKVEQTDNKTE